MSTYRTITALALLGAASTAQADTSVRYDGELLVDFQTSTGQPHPGMLEGVFGFSAIFYYDSLGEQRAASLIVDDVLRAHYTFCPGMMFQTCSPLTITPTAIQSDTGLTPEAFIQAGVFSPSQFGGLDLLGPGRRVYVLAPCDPAIGGCDQSYAAVAWSLFDDETGFAWNDGFGEVDRVTLAVPEPASWAMLIAGFGLTGAAMRRRRATAA